MSAKSGPATSRANTAPAYYLGRPARLWITAMNPQDGHTASGYRAIRPGVYSARADGGRVRDLGVRDGSASGISVGGLAQPGQLRHRRVAFRTDQRGAPSVANPIDTTAPEP